VVRLGRRQNIVPTLCLNCAELRGLARLNCEPFYGGLRVAHSQDRRGRVRQTRPGSPDGWRTDQAEKLWRRQPTILRGVAGPRSSVPGSYSSRLSNASVPLRLLRLTSVWTTVEPFSRIP
jgi:hypothetical protein